MPHPYASVLCAVGWELSPNHHRLEGDLSRTEPRTETLSRLADMDGSKSSAVRLTAMQNRLLQSLEALLLFLKRKSAGFVAVGIFLFFGATMASLAAATLLWRGTVLDRAWKLNPTAYRQLAPLGSKVGIAFLLLGTALLVSGVGWFRRRLWAWKLAVVIIAIQVLGDVLNLARGDLLRGATGAIIASSSLLYLLSSRISAQFSDNPD
jgi:hypothetical protein